MGNQLAVSGGAATVNINDVSNQLLLISPMGGQKKGRLFTSLHCTDGAKDLVVKIFVRTADDEEQNKLIKLFAERLTSLESRLRAYYAKNTSSPCNTLFYTFFSKNERFCMLQRPKLHYSLPERLLIRPFLAPHQRLFLAYQLLLGLHQLHNTFGATHGDLKAENVLVTTAGWLYVTDLAPFKPPRLASSNPADFEYYYDNAEQRLCSIAPERFCDPDTMPKQRFEAKVLPSMDVFSAGCVVFHLLTDAPLFKLSDILDFRQKNKSEKEQYLRDRWSEQLPGKRAAQYPSEALQLLIDALCSSPEERPTVQALARKFTPSLFPHSFHFLYYNVLPAVLGLPPDLQIQSLWNRFADLLDTAVRYKVDIGGAAASGTSTATLAGSPTPRFGGGATESSQQSFNRLSSSSSILPGDSADCVELLPPKAPGMKLTKDEKMQQRFLMDIVAPVVCVAMRHCRLLDSQAKALTFLKNASGVSSVSVTRDLMLPAVIAELNKKSNPSIARAASIRGLVSICEALCREKFPMGECLVFEDLVLPALYQTFKDNRSLVQLELCRGTPRILRCALHYVDTRQSMGNVLEWNSTYDYQRHVVIDRGWDLLRPFFQNQNSSLLTSLLSNVTILAEALGPEKVQTELLPVMFTLLGHPQVEVRRSMLKRMVDIALLLQTAHSQIIQVCIEDGLRDSDPRVIVVALDGTRQLCRAQDCLPQADLIRIVQSSVVLLGYPDRWVAQSAALLVEECAKQFNQVDVLVHLEGAVQPLLRFPVALSTLSSNQDYVKPAASLAYNTMSAGGATVSELCSDYIRKFPDPQLIEVPHDAAVRTAGDIPCDSQHIDVGDRLQFDLDSRERELANRRGEEIDSGENASFGSSVNPTSGRPTSVISMRIFHPTHRQQLRLLWRQWRPHGRLDPGDARALGERARRATMLTINRMNRGMSIAAVPSLPPPPQAQGMANPAALRSRSIIGGGQTGNYQTTAQVSSSVSGADGIPTRVIPSSQLQGVPVDERQQPMRPCAAPIALSSEHNGPVYALACGGKLMATGGVGGKLRIWDVEETIFPQQEGANILKASATTKVPGSSTSSATTILVADFLNLGTVACGTNEGQLGIYDIEYEQFTGDSTPVHQGQAGGISAMVPQPSGLLLLGSHRGGIYGIDRRVSPVKEVWSCNLPRAQGPMSAMLLADTFGLVCGTLRGTVALYDLRFRQQVYSFQVASNYPCVAARCVHSMTSAPVRAENEGPSVLVATENADILRYSLKTKAETLCLQPAASRSVRQLMTVPKTKVCVSGGTDRLLRIWDIAQPEQSYTLTCHPARSPEYNHSKGAATVAESNDCPVKSHHKDTITALGTAVVRSQQYLVSASRDGVVKIWHNQSPQ